MTIPKDEPGEALPDLEFIRIKDSGGSRSGIDRRQTPSEYDSPESRSGRDRRRGFDRRAGIDRRRTPSEYDSPESRSGRDRRRGFDRRAGIDRRRTNDRRLSGSFWEGETIERREVFRKKQGE